MSATCNPDGGCNAGCCNPVVLPVTLREVAMLLPGDPFLGDGDRAWMLNDLLPMTRREGLARSPHLSQGGMTVGLIHGEISVLASFFYDCRWFDHETRRCTNYEHRPDACRQYPWYGGSADPSKALPKHCAYLEDVPVTMRAPVYRDTITVYED